MRVVVKIGTSSLTSESGEIDQAMIASLAEQVAQLREDDHEVVMVSSGAIAAGVPALGMTKRPRKTQTLQAISAVGQSRLMRVYDDAFAHHGLVSGQVLLVPHDFFERDQYLHARRTLEALLGLGVIPIINENDAIADDAIRFGDNDRIAALVAQLLGADLLVLLTDTAGVLTADPRRDESASLITDIVEVDASLERMATSTGSARGSGGMASKLGAAKIAAWGGVRSIIAAAHRDDVLRDAVAGVDGVGTVVHPRPNRLAARKLWIAFGVRSGGTIVVDDGARHALCERGTSLLSVGVTAATGTFRAGEAVEIAGPDGEVFAKGIVSLGAAELRALLGGPQDGEVVHRDGLVVLPQ